MLVGDVHTPNDRMCSSRGCMLFNPSFTVPIGISLLQAYSCTSGLCVPEWHTLSKDVRIHEVGMRSSRGCILFDVCFAVPRGMLLGVHL